MVSVSQASSGIVRGQVCAFCRQRSMVLLLSVRSIVIIIYIYIYIFLGGGILYRFMDFCVLHTYMKSYVFVVLCKFDRFFNE